jgi:hypothetical protein
MIELICPRQLFGCWGSNQPLSSICSGEIMTTLQTQNECYGFFGTIRNRANAKEAWRIAMGSVAKKTQFDPDVVREFLDSNYGRWFAEEVCNHLLDDSDLENAIELATTRWMVWTTSQFDIATKVGQPYLIEIVGRYKS